MAVFVRERGWPQGPVDLLLKAIVAPQDIALAAWREWCRGRDFDAISWQEMRLVACFSQRIGDLDPESPYRPRIEGLTKNLWTKSHLTLMQSGEALDLLVSAGIDAMVFKGAALHAEGFGPSCRRIVGDVDILVREADYVRAMELICGAGWQPVNGESLAYLRAVAPVRLSGNFMKGMSGDVDLHTSPFHYGRTGGSRMDVLWEKARPAKLALREVLMPDPAHAIAISLAHAPLGSGGDWAVDAATRAHNQDVDWDAVAETAIHFGNGPAIASGMRYLNSALGLDIPASAFETLERAKTSMALRLKHWANTSDRAARPVIQKAADRIADRLLTGQGYALLRKDRDVIAVRRRDKIPFALRHGPGRAVPVDDALSAERLRHTIDLTSQADRRWLQMTINMAAPAISRRVFFDVTRAGKAIARLRTRIGGERKANRTRVTFTVPLTANAGDVVIEARPAGYAPDHAKPAAKSAIAALPFRIERLRVA